MPIDIVSGVLNQLLFDEQYFRKVLPFIKSEYFEIQPEKILFQLIKDHADKYSKPIPKDVLSIKVGELNGLDESDYSELIDFVKEISTQSYDLDEKWILDETELWCGERSVYLALVESVSIVDGEDKRSKDAIPDILRNALSISFDNSIGHEYFADAKERYESWNSTETKIQLNLDYFNRITGGDKKTGKGGGFADGTLNLIAGGPGSGKSVWLVHNAAHYIRQGKNVVYISMEMSENEISKRVDANLLDYDINKLKDIPEKDFLSKVSRISQAANGRLFVKQYPTGLGNVNQFKALIDELSIKKNFKADVIIVDYLNICGSTQTDLSAGTYIMVKSIAEELRGFAIELGLPILSAIQFNRSGAGDSDADLGSISDSFGIAFTADFACALIRTDEMDEMGIAMIKQMKNRYLSETLYQKFIVGLDTFRMKFFDADQTFLNSDDEEDMVEQTKSFKGEETTKDFSGIKF